MRIALYWSVVVNVIEVFGYYALVRYPGGESCIVPFEDLTFQGGN